MKNNNVIKGLMALSALHGRELNENATEMYLAVLRSYDPEKVYQAIQDCLRTINRFPMPSDIIQRIEALDGRPGAEEAWAMLPKSEAQSVVWTDEMSQAYGLVHRQMCDDDLIGARMAFKEKYETLVKIARRDKAPVKWVASLGFNPEQRKVAIEQAISLGQLPTSSRQLLIETKPPEEELPVQTPEDAEKVRVFMEDLKKRLAAKVTPQ